MLGKYVPLANKSAMFSKVVRKPNVLEKNIRKNDIGRKIENKLKEHESERDKTMAWTIDVGISWIMYLVEMESRGTKCVPRGTNQSLSPLKG